MEYTSLWKCEMQINSVVKLIVTKADLDRDPVSFINKCNEEANN